MHVALPNTCGSASFVAGSQAKLLLPQYPPGTGKILQYDWRLDVASESDRLVYANLGSNFAVCRQMYKGGGGRPDHFQDGHLGVCRAGKRWGEGVTERLVWHARRHIKCDWEGPAPN